MYLIARPLVQANLLLEYLQANGVKVGVLPLIDTRLNPNSYYDSVIRINNCDGVLFTSPTSIDYMSEKLALISPTCKLFAVGASSANYLKDKTAGRLVNYPQRISGVRGLIAENILSGSKIRKLAVIGSEKMNQTLLDYLTINQVEYDFIDLYKRVNIGLENPLLIRKLLSDTANVGIIITSKLIAEYLVTCANELDLNYIVTAKKLITIHPQITEYLYQQGFKNLCETSSADKNSVLTLLRDLEYERQ